MKAISVLQENMELKMSQQVLEQAPTASMGLKHVNQDWKSQAITSYCTSELLLQQGGKMWVFQNLMGMQKILVSLERTLCRVFRDGHTETTETG